MTTTLARSETTERPTGRTWIQHWDVEDRDTGTVRAKVVMKAGDVCAMPADIRHQGFAPKRSMLMVMENGTPGLEKRYAGCVAFGAMHWDLHGWQKEIKDKLAKLREAGVGMLFIPTFLLPADRRQTLDRFMAEVAPAFRA